MTHTPNNGFKIKRENTVANHIDTHILDIHNCLILRKIYLLYH